MTKALQYIEIDLDHCSLTYSVAPCQATLTGSPPTGTKKCFNTPGTCQDRANYTLSPITMRFAIPTDYLPNSIEAIPNIKEISFSPGLVSLGQNLGQRSALTITFEDHKHSDTGAGGDKYLADRAYDPYQQGTFLAKFRARNKFLSGRPLRWINGVLGQTLAQMETHHYIIDSYEGPSGNGEFTITAKDILRLADGDKSLAPATSPGSVNAAITNVDTTVTLKPTGAGASYIGVGYVTLGGSEIAQFTHQEGYTGDSPAAGPNAIAITSGGASYNLTAWVGAVDGKQFTISFWIKRHATQDMAFWVGVPSAVSGDKTNSRVDISFNGSTARFRFVTRDTSAVANLNVESASATLLNVWYHVIASFDLSDPAKRWIYISDVADAGTYTTYTNSNIDFTLANHNIGTYQSGTGQTNADIAALWFNLSYMDLSVVANRRLFITADKRPVDLGTNGQNPLGSTPLAYFNAPGGGTNWRVNLGTGGGYISAVFNPPATTFDDGDSLTLLARGQLGTTAASHSVDDRVQTVLQYTSQDPAIIINDLLHTYANIPTSFIPLASWLSETQTYLGQLYTAVIPAPVAVADLVSELIEQAGLVLWWDDADQQVGLAVVRGSIPGTQQFNSDNTLADSLTITDQPDKRLSQVFTYFGQINPTVSLTQKDNYRSLAVGSATQAEADYGSAAIKEIFSRWIPAGAKPTADKLNSILLQRFQDAPRHFKFQQFRDVITIPELARTYMLRGWPIQTDEGAATGVQLQVTRVKPMADIIEIEGDELLFTATDTTIRNVTFDASRNDVNARTAHDALYTPPQSGNMVNFTVSAGVVLGSSSQSSPALNIGSWPAGVTVTLTVLGRLEGCGGRGGTYFGVQGGLAGGTALFTRQAITLTDGSGQIWGGGGGGGAGLAGPNDIGGGGGAGTLPGVGGNSNSGFPGQPGTDTTGGAAGFPAGASPGAGPGLAASNGNIGTGGAAGIAIDGISFITTSGTAGDRRGPQV